MCRIVGFMDSNNFSYDMNKVLFSMRDVLEHGGPDDFGSSFFKQNGVALGHRRLSVIDISKLGNQPFCDSSKNFWVVYNGEIYNFKEIRKELEKDNYIFKSNSDTEVLLYSYLKWGVNCVQKFRGMFSFAIYEKETNKLILFRDRIGVKPLYWYFKDGLFMFSSELKAFHKHPKFRKEINDEALSYYLQYSYVPTPLCIFKNTHKLEVGSYLTFHENKVEISKYWDIENYINHDSGLINSESETLDLLEKKILESFQLRTVSDVPYGVFLSGGIDSTLIATLLQKEQENKLKTFTIGFHDKNFNEAHLAKETANFLGTDHNELYLDTSKALNLIPELPYIYDEPFADPSSLPTVLLSRFTKQHVKVSLSADGGDELFFGYTRYHKLHQIQNSFFAKITNNVNHYSPKTIDYILKSYINLLKVDNKLDLFEKLKSTISAKNYLQKANISHHCHSPNLRKELGIYKDSNLSNWIKKTDPNFIEIPNLLDFKTYLPDAILCKLDRASMSVGLEGRDPFLDHELVEFTLKLPHSFKYKNNISKYPLKKILQKYLPENIINRPKKGFSIPVKNWLQNDLKSLTDHYLSEKQLNKKPILKTSVVKENLRQFHNNEGINSNRIWNILMFEMWKERWF